MAIQHSRNESEPSRDRTTRTEVVLSAGIGRLHFVETANALLPFTPELKLIIGLSPPNRFESLINLVGKAFGRSNTFERLRRRASPELVNGRHLIGLPDAEIFGQVVIRLLERKVLRSQEHLRRAWEYFGWRTRPHLATNTRVFHFRSGAGRGGACKKASHIGIRTVCDHSIAHPKYITKALRRSGLETTAGLSECYEGPFWNSVLQDCMESDCLLVNSDFVADTFVEQGFDRSRIKIAYLGIDEPFLNNRRHWRRSEPFKILFTGSTTIRKGIHHVLQTCRRLDAEHINYELHIAGDSSNLAPLLDACPTRGRVVTHGFLNRESLLSLMNRSDAYLFPSLAEGCAKSVMEAWGAGLPVICTRATGTPIANEKDGLIVDEGDIEGMRTALMRIRNHLDFACMLGDTASKRARQHFSWSNYGRHLAEIHGNALQ